MLMGVDMMIGLGDRVIGEDSIFEFVDVLLDGEFEWVGG
jgi:hypothetical protein